MILKESLLLAFFIFTSAITLPKTSVEATQPSLSPNLKRTPPRAQKHGFESQNISDFTKSVRKTLKESQRSATEDNSKEPINYLRSTEYTRISNEETLNDSEAVEKLIEVYIALLQTFVSDIGFDRLGFLSSAANLNKLMVALTYWVHKNQPSSITLRHLSFAKRMLYSMQDAVESAHFFSNSKQLGYHILHCMTELNVRLYALYSVSGKPNTSLRGFKNALREFSLLADFWHEKFSQLEVVSYSLKVMVNSQYEDAIKMIEELSAHSKLADTWV